MPVKNKKMVPQHNIMLFTDGSADVKSGIGYGACLLVSDLETLPDSLKKQVQIRRFENTSSVRLELETLLWALRSIPAQENCIEVYTDSQNIISLPVRRKRLEQADYHSKNNRLLANHDLYKEFYEFTDRLNIELIKVTGHQPAGRKDAVHKLFSIVDKASRNALRKNLPDG